MLYTSTLQKHLCDNPHRHLEHCFIQKNAYIRFTTSICTVYIVFHNTIQTKSLKTIPFITFMKTVFCNC